MKLLALPKENDREQIYRFIYLSLSGVESPKNATEGVQSDDYGIGFESKIFTETRLLNRRVSVRIEGNFETTFFGTVLHSAGNISELLLKEGLAKINEHSIKYVSDPSKYRLCEKKAKEQKVGMWKDVIFTSNKNDESTILQGVVVQVISAESLLVLLDKTNEEKKIYLAGIKQPKPIKEGNLLTGYSFEAKEYLRALSIGKHVKIIIENVKPASSDGFEERTQCTVILANKKNIAECLLKKGLASIVRPRKDEIEIISCFDELVAAHDKYPLCLLHFYIFIIRAVKESLGIYANGGVLPSLRIVDASETPAKAKSFLHGLTRKEEQHAIVEWIISPSKYRLFLPQENIKLVFSLNGCNSIHRKEGNSTAELNQIKNILLQREV